MIDPYERAAARQRLLEELDRVEGEARLVLTRGKYAPGGREIPRYAAAYSAIVRRCRKRRREWQGPDVARD